MSLAKRIANWEGCEKSSTYYYPDGHKETDVVFPGKLYNRVAQLLRLPPQELDRLFRSKDPKTMLLASKAALKFFGKFK